MENYLLLLDYPYQVRDFLDHSAHRRSVGTLHDLIQLPQSQAADDSLLLLRKRDRAAIVLDSDLRRRRFTGFRFSRHILSWYQVPGLKPRINSETSNSKAETKLLQIFDLLTAQAGDFKRILHL